MKDYTIYPVLSVGSRGPSVVTLQAALGLSQDGHFGPATQSAVRKYQLAKGLTPDGIVGAATWGALGLLKPEKHLPKYLMLHTTAGNQRWTAQQVIDYHEKTLGWGRPGYHKIVTAAGSVVDSWKFDLSDGFDGHEYSYGAKEFNPVSIHVCWIGGLDAQGNPFDNRTTAQRAALSEVVFALLNELPSLLVMGHNQAHNKACPCFSVPKWCREIGVPETNIYQPDPFGYAARLSA